METVIVGIIALIVGAGGGSFVTYKYAEKAKAAIAADLAKANAVIAAAKK